MSDAASFVLDHGEHLLTAQLLQLLHHPDSLSGTLSFFTFLDHDEALQSLHTSVLKRVQSDSLPKSRKKTVFTLIYGNEDIMKADDLVQMKKKNPELTPVKEIHDPNKGYEFAPKKRDAIKELKSCINNKRQKVEGKVGGRVIELD